MNDFGRALPKCVDPKELVRLPIKQQLQYAGFIAQHHARGNLGMSRCPGAICCGFFRCRSRHRGWLNKPRRSERGTLGCQETNLPPARLIANVNQRVAHLLLIAFVAILFAAFYYRTQLESLGHAMRESESSAAD